MSGKNSAAGIIIWELSEDYYQQESVLLEVVGRGEFVKKAFLRR
ncbi:MAG: hypothetical protein ACLFVG_01315 [Candidatus Aminicenantes bacterium]